MTRAQLRTHVTHDTNTEHDFPVSGRTIKDLTPPTSDKDSIFKSFSGAPTASRPTGRKGCVAPGRGGNRSPEPPSGAKRDHLYPHVPTPTKDLGRGAASSPGQGKEDFDANPYCKEGPQP